MPVFTKLKLHIISKYTIKNSRFQKIKSKNKGLKNKYTFTVYFSYQKFYRKSCKFESACFYSRQHESIIQCIRLQVSFMVCNSPCKNTGVGSIPFSRGLSNLGIKPRSPALWADSLLSEQPGKPHIRLKPCNNFFLKQIHFTSLKTSALALK